MVKGREKNEGLGPGQVARFSKLLAASSPSRCLSSINGLSPVSTACFETLEMVDLPLCITI